MKEMFFKMVKAIAVLVVIIIILSVGDLLAKRADTKIYNDGICSECGGHYVFSGVVQFRNGEADYYYTCDRCGHTVKTNEIMK